MKKLFLSLAVVAVSAIGLYATATSSSTPEVVTIHSTESCAAKHMPTEGKHCSGTVGCDCSGFSPILNGKEWQKSYCKRCGHAKSYHR